jgi:mono/diheme cytochrome c family protein
MAAGSQAFAARPAGVAPAVATYTVSQAYQGRFAYIENCAECHGGDLTGNFGPALAGPHSNIPWQTPEQVYSYMTSQMPVGNAGGLSQRDYLDIEAFILESNGRRAANKPLTLAGIMRDPTHLDGSR